MNYEKKYKEALERAKELIEKRIGKNKDFYTEDYSYIFPELAEIEDDRIRKDLIAFLIDMKDGDVSCFPSQSLYQRWIAYLEKQKEHPNGCFTCDEYKKGYEAGRLNGITAGYNKAKKEQEPAERSLEDDHIIGFVYDLLNEIEWKDSWAMSKDECLRLLSNYSPQKPAEWGEEDEEMVNNILYILGQYIDYKTVSGTGSGYATPRYGKEIDWLKSLHTQPSWKPSEEQMNCLCAAVDAAIRKHNESVNGYKPARVLKSLYEQLKKLM